jgi:hypothetical protein
MSPTEAVPSLWFVRQQLGSTCTWPGEVDDIRAMSVFVQSLVCRNRQMADLGLMFLDGLFKLYLGLFALFFLLLTLLNLFIYSSYSSYSFPSFPSSPSHLARPLHGPSWQLGQDLKYFRTRTMHWLWQTMSGIQVSEASLRVSRDFK